MKTCVFITGTNSVGKTTLAKALIERFGGIKETAKELTFAMIQEYVLPDDTEMKTASEV